MLPLLAAKGTRAAAYFAWARSPFLARNHAPHAPPPNLLYKKNRLQVPLCFTPP